MKRLNAYKAQLGRICCPKPASGKLEVNPEIYAQWKKGGAARDALLEILVANKGDKEQYMLSVYTTVSWKL